MTAVTRFLSKKSPWAANLFGSAMLMATGAAQAYDAGRFGETRLAEPQGAVRAFVILFADRGGWTAVDDAVAHALAAEGALVVEVDTDAYLARLDAVDEKCHWPEGDAEGLSRKLQRERGYPHYLTPILGGIGQGGTLAGVALGEASAATIDGAMALNPTPAIVSRRPLCTALPAKPGHHSFQYAQPKTLPGFSTVGLTADAPSVVRRHLAGRRSAGGPVELRDLAAGIPPAQAMAELLAPHLAALQPQTGTIAALPLIPLPVDHPSDLMAVVLSGDGGWRDLDKTIAEQLNHDGLPVIGWDCLRYFWSKKTAEQTAEDLSAVLHEFMGKWGATKVALVGYSFGAGVLPFAYSRLPADLRAHIRLMALLGFDRRSDFEISPTGWLGAPPGTDALDVLPEMDKIPGPLVQCFYGQEESDSACPALAARGAEVIRTTGGHHFDGDYVSLAQRILTGFRQR